MRTVPSSSWRWLGVSRRSPVRRDGRRPARADAVLPVPTTRTTFITTPSNGTSTRPNTSRSTTTRGRRRISNGSPATPRAPTSKSAPTSARAALQGTAHPLQDAQRVRAAERRVDRRVVGRCRGVRRLGAPPDADADRRADRPAVRLDHPRAHAHLRLRHHPAEPDSPEHAAVGERRARRLRTRPVGSASI